MNRINRTHRFLSFTHFAGCIIVIGLLNVPAFAAVLDSTPTALSIKGVPPTGLLGWSLGISANGQVAAGGAPATNGSSAGSTDYTGAAYVYTQANGIWSDPITLSTTGIPTEGEFGESIAVSANGQQVIVGAPNLNGLTGAVYVFTESGGSWANTPTRAALTVPTGITTGYSFGYGLAVSSDGRTLIVGARQTSVGTGQGVLYAYTLSGTTWGNPVALTVTGIAKSSFVGGSISVSADGSIVIAGGPNANSTAGSAYVWTKSGGTWSNPVALTPPSTNGTKGNFGSSVGISGDGTVVIIGAPFANNSNGAAYVYTKSGSSWSTNPAMISVGSGSGYSVALSPDGKTAFIGLPGGGKNSTGQVYTATYNGSGWGTPVALSTTNVAYGAIIGEVLAQADNGQELLTAGESANSDLGGLWVYASPANITLAATPSAQSVAPGSTLTFNLTLTNTDQPGSTPATTMNNVVLTDTLPAGTTYVSSNAATGSCSHTSSTVICTLSALTPGNNSQNPWAPSITVNTPSSAATLTNTLTVSANEPLVGSTSVNTPVTNDVVPTVKSGTVSTATNKAVSGTLSATLGFQGQTLTFTIVSPPSDGTATLTNAATGAFTYTPNSGFSGTDTFVWMAGDGFVSAAPVAESIVVGASSSGSGSSGKSGGGALGLLTLGLLGFFWERRRRRLS